MNTMPAQRQPDPVKLPFPTTTQRLTGTFS
jgi:hypothetical protein